MVDIMIVRKRMRQPSVMGRVALSLAPLCVEREVELHEAFLLTMPISMTRLMNA